VARGRKFARRLNGLRALLALVALSPLGAWSQQDGAAPGAADPPASAPSFMNELSRVLLTDNSDGFSGALSRARWRGNLGFEQRWTRADDLGRRDQTLEYGSVDMATYLGQPWLAQVRANLGFIASHVTGTDVREASFHGEAGRGLTLTGGSELSLFPNSRFPFTASFQLNDSRTSGEASPSDYTSLLTSIRQSYRSPLGDEVYNASLERSVLDSRSFGRDTVTALNAAGQRTFDAHVLDLAASYARNRRAETADGSDVSRLSAHHGWRPSDDAALDTFASFSDTDFVRPNADALRTRFIQLNSLGTWRPGPESPLFATASARFADATFGGPDTTARTAGLNLAATYALSPHANVVAAGGLTRVQAGDDSRLVSTESLGGNYSPAPINAAGFTYSWSTAGSASNENGAEDDRHRTLGAQATHQVSRLFSLGPSAQLNVNVAQGYSVLDETDRGVTRTLAYSGGVSLHVQPGASSDAFIGLSGGDSRSHGAREEHLELGNLQVSGQLQFGPYSALFGNLTLQAVRQQLGEEAPGHTTVQRSGNLTFEQRRVFHVRQLRYVASATFNDIQLESRLLGDVNAPREQYSRVFEQRLQYQIVLLDVRIGMRLATLDGKADRQAFIRIDRQFGSP